MPTVHRDSNFLCGTLRSEKPYTRAFGGPSANFSTLETRVRSAVISNWHATFDASEQVTFRNVEEKVPRPFRARSLIVRLAAISYCWLSWSALPTHTAC
jgi:hypothetical protein